MPSKNYFKDLITGSFRNANGKRLHVMWGIIGILLVRMLYKKKSDTERILNSASTYINTNRGAGKKKSTSMTTMDYIKLLKLCQKVDPMTYPIIGGYAVLLMTRILVTIRLMTNISKTIKHLTNRNWDKMFNLHYKFATMCFPAAALSSLQNYLERSVQLKIKTNMTKALTEKYFSNNCFYKVSDPNVDKIITNDVENFSQEFVNCFNGIAKPSVDVVYLSFLLSKKLGYKNVMYFYAYFLTTTTVLSKLKLPFSKLIKQRLAIDSIYKSNLSRTRAYVEQITFLKGGEKEKEISDNKVNDSYDYAESVSIAKIMPDAMDSYYMKYGGMMIGYMIIIPKIYNGSFKGDQSDITGHYVLVANFLGSLGRGIMELIGVQKTLTNLNGISERIKDVVTDLDTNSDIDPNYTIASEPDAPIRIDNGTIKTPRGEILVKDLNIVIHQDESMVVVGRNGTGKTSLFRVLAGIWKTNGNVTISPDTKFIPQESYFTIDTFYNSVIYPETEYTDNDKKNIDLLVEAVGIRHVVDRYGYSEPIDWTDRLSGGEKQRLSIVRALYDSPKYCIMDEVTSAMSNDIETKIYEICNERKITIVSIVHNSMLERFHNKKLSFKGNGEWEVEQITEIKI